MKFGVVLEIFSKEFFIWFLWFFRDQKFFILDKVYIGVSFGEFYVFVIF